ncbi:hypothetical protein GCM10011380_07000 [Sphingomonas metalli]|uniref:ABC transporter domain-containing protein n=1 Tax=Sphingomonas metalli TaxID=1779358 RepID=A0A916WQH0_9SPHN|nr:ATP-binding cassette domain-containing protein [Sphingomonas metalli]GGB20036.1 hypothetical protein GCM10011380_07000 [Sphingomonas metalli]
MTLLAMRDVACRRGGRMLFTGLDLTLAPGDAVVVTGPNGVGKSSLIRMAAGLLRPAAGSVAAAPAALLDERAALDAELPLDRALRFWVEVDGSIPAEAGVQMGSGGMGLESHPPVIPAQAGIHRAAGADASSRAEALIPAFAGATKRKGEVALAPGRIVERGLAALDLTPLARVPVRLLSTGQRRRAALARVAVSPARLWLLDEPANGLDAAAVARLEALVAAHRAAGGAVLVATHLPLAIPGAEALALEAAA